MPYFYQTFFTSCNDQIFFSVQNGVEYLTISLDVAICCVAEHCLQMRKGTNCFVAFVLVLKAILQNFVDLKLIKV